MHIGNFASLTDEGCLQSSSSSCGLLTGHITSSVHPDVVCEEGRESMGLRTGKVTRQRRGKRHLCQQNSLGQEKDKRVEKGHTT